MQAGPLRPFAAALVVAAAAIGCGITTSRGAEVAAGQPAAKPAAPQDNDLEAAAAKVRDGRLEEALGLIQQRSGKHPEWPPAQVVLARLLFASNQVPQGRHALEQAAALAPDHPEIYLMFGGISLSERRLSDAWLNFEKGRDLAGAGAWNAERTRGFQLEAYAGLAAVAEAREDWKSAQAELTALLALEPKNGQARQNLGRALFRLGMPEEAFAALDQAVKDVPVLEPAAISMGWLYSRKGDLKKATDWFEHARTLEPRSARVRVARAAWLLEQGQAATARTEIDEAVKLDPASKEAQTYRGLIAWHLHDFAAAEEIFEPLHRDAPANPMAANHLALALIEQNDEAKRARGLQLADVNVAQFPRSPEVLATLGWALYRAGRLDQAEAKLRAAVTGGRTTPDIAYFLARVLVDTGKTDDARKLLESATKQPTAFAHRDDATSLLKTLTK